MIDLKDMISIYYAMRKNKRRSADSIIFEINFERNILSLCNEIDNLTLRADANYTFITLTPRPREIFAAEMGVRLCHAYIADRLIPILDKILIPRTFNNRIGYGCDAAINNVITDIYDISEGFTKDAWIIKWDLSGFFPNADIDVAFSRLKDVIYNGYSGNDKNTILWLLMICLYSHPQNHCYRKSAREMWNHITFEKSLFNKDEHHGAAIGFLIWQIAMGYYTNDVNRWLIDDCGLKCTVFVDDTVCITDNKECMLELLPKLRSRYSDIGVRMNEKKFYCQHYTKGLEFLGSHIKKDRIYLNNRTIYKFIKRIKAFNSYPIKRAYCSIDEFISCVNSYLGQLKGRNEYNNILRIVSIIDEKWLVYVHFDKDRCVMAANEGYSYRDRLCKRYNIKLKRKKNETVGKRCA